MFFFLFLPRGSFVLPSQGWEGEGGGGPFWEPFSYDLYDSFDKKHENNKTSVSFRFVLPRGSLFV